MSSEVLVALRNAESAISLSRFAMLPAVISEVSNYLPGSSGSRGQSSNSELPGKVHLACPCPKNSGPTYEDSHAKTGTFFVFANRELPRLPNPNSSLSLNLKFQLRQSAERLREAIVKLDIETHPPFTNIEHRDGNGGLEKSGRRRARIFCHDREQEGNRGQEDTTGQKGTASQLVNELAS